MEDEYEWENYEEMMRQDEEASKTPKQKFRENVLEKLNGIACSVNDGGIVDQLSDLNETLKELIKIIKKK